LPLDPLDDSDRTATGESSREKRHRPRLLVFSDEASQTFDLPETGTVTIGRGDQASIRVHSSSISRIHAMLHLAQGPTGELHIEVEDNGSANGTKVQGRPLEKGERRLLSPGEAFDVGSTMMMVQLIPKSASVRPRRLWTHGDFEAKLEDECARAKDKGGGFVLLRLRVSAPHATALEEMLARTLRPFDLIAAYAPGEYEVLVVDGTMATASAMGTLLEAPIVRDRGKLEIGVAFYPADGRTAADLAACAAERVRASSSDEHEVDEAPPEVVIASGGPMAGLFRLIERVAPSDIAVLILGETGVGKEVVAERVHQSSKRSEGPFVKLNCAALSASLLESELFGHERGAFTGAAEAKPGLLETAQGGTIFLDEIGELSLAIQVKLLRVLEEKQVLRVGGLKPRTIQVRFIAATNRDLEDDIAKGTFRSDFYYRLNGVTLMIPPLRERRDEIEPLARAFALRALRALGEHGSPRITAEAMVVLRQYYWPGNIRELRNIVERAVLLSGGATIDRDHLPLDKLCATTLSVSQIPRAAPIAPSASLPERQAIIDALEKCVGNQTRAAKMLGISRSTLVSRLDAFDIPRPRKP